MNKYKYLTEYFQNSISDKIVYLNVILEVDNPLIVYFETLSESYITHLNSIDEENLNADWLISKTSKQDVLEAVLGNITLKDVFSDNCFLFHVKDNKTSINKNVKNTVHENFNLIKVPNEQNLDSVYLEIERKTYL